MLDTIDRPQSFTCHNGEKAELPFSAEEYARRLAGLRRIMAQLDLPAVLLTSMHNIAYYTGFSLLQFRAALWLRGDRGGLHHGQRQYRRRPAVAAEPLR